MAKDVERIIGALEAKLDILHEDIKGIREEVEVLKKEMTQRGVIYKIAGWGLGIATAIITMLINIGLTTHK